MAENNETNAGGGTARNGENAPFGWAASALLLADVKLSLNITWDDQNTDRSVQMWIDNGIAYLNDKLGAVGDYETPGFPRTLLFEYVRYSRDAALDVFENNYQSLLLAMKNNRLVEAFAAGSGAGGGETTPQSPAATAPLAQGSQEAGGGG